MQLTGNALAVARETARTLGLGEIVRAPDLRAGESSLVLLVILRLFYRGGRW